MKSTNYTRGSEDNFHLLILFQAGSDFPSDLASRLSPSLTPVKQLARSQPSENFLLEENPRLKEAHSSEGRQTAGLAAREGGWGEAGEHQKADAGATRVIREPSEIGEILEMGFADGFRTKPKCKQTLEAGHLANRPRKGTEGLGEPSSAQSSFWEHTKRSPTCQESMHPSFGYTRPQRHPTGPAGEAGEVGKDQTSVQRRKQRRRDAHTPAHPPSRAGITTQINRKPKKKKKGTGQKGTRSASEENRKVKEALT